MATRPKHGPAAGTRQGAAPRLAGLHLPDVIALDRDELDPLLRVLRAPLAFHLYGLLRVQADFSTGHVLTEYARLMDLMTEPSPERGRRVSGPTYEQVRRAVRLLEASGLVRRDTDANALQGQLRVYLPHVERRSSEWKKKHARANRPQGLAQGPKARKPA
jgi:hypothetical protein